MRPKTGLMRLMVGTVNIWQLNTATNLRFA